MGASSKKSGALSFFIAALIYVAGYRLISGGLPGAGGALKWWSFLVLILLWGAVDVAFDALRRRGKK
jgi:hypothetical protein